MHAPFLTLSGVARRAQLPISTTHGLINELTAHGLLERVGDHHYRLGNRLWEIGARTPGAAGVREIAGRHLLDLHQRLGQHVQIAVRYETDALILDRISSQEATVNASVVGGHMPLPHTALGLILLAYGPAALVARVLDEGLRPPTRAALADEAELKAAIEMTRRCGYAVADGYIHHSARGVAVPVTGHRRVVVAALGVVVSSDGSPISGIAMELQRTAARISNTLARIELPAGHEDALPGGMSRYLVASSTASMRYLGRRGSSKPASGP